MEKIRVLVADDHVLVRDGLCQLLEAQEDLECVARAKNGEEAVKLANKFLPDVAIIDVAMPEMNGIEAARQIKAACPSTAILIVSAYKYSYYVLACIRAGVDGYLLKDTPRDEFVSTIRAVHAGKRVFDVKAIDGILHDIATKKDTARLGLGELGTRELQVLKLAAMGMGNKEIGHELGITADTVGSHFVNIFRKLGVQSRTEAVLYALKEGWFNIDDLG